MLKERSSKNNIERSQTLSLPYPYCRHWTKDATDGTARRTTSTKEDDEYT